MVAPVLGAGIPLLPLGNKKAALARGNRGTGFYFEARDTMNHTTPLAAEQAFAVIRDALTWMGIEICHCLYAAPHWDLIDLTILFAAESIWQAEYAVEQGFCTDVLRGDIAIVLEASETRSGFYKVDLMIPAKVL